MSTPRSWARRIVVVGCCGAGKSTLSATVARRLGVRHVERDTLGDEGSAAFRLAVADLVARDSWIFDGAPSHAVRWAWSVWDERRREIARLDERPELAGAEILRLRSPRAATCWLSTIAGHSQ